MRVALVLVHNGSASANAQAVSTIAALVTPVAQDPNAFTISGVPSQFFTVYHIVPSGFVMPANASSVPSYRSVIYRTPSTTGQIFNWAARRAIDDSGDVMAQITDAAQFTVSNINASIAKFSGVHFLENEPWGRAVTVRWLLAILDLLDDGKTYAQLIAGYKARAVERGLVNG